MGEKGASAAAAVRRQQRGGQRASTGIRACGECRRRDLRWPLQARPWQRSPAASRRRRRLLGGQAPLPKGGSSEAPRGRPPVVSAASSVAIPGATRCLSEGVQGAVPETTT